MVQWVPLAKEMRVECLLRLREVSGCQKVPCSPSRVFLRGRRHMNLVPPRPLFAFSWRAEWIVPWRSRSLRLCHPHQPHLQFPLHRRDVPRPLQILNLLGEHPRVSEVLRISVPFSEVFCASDTWPLPWSLFRRFSTWNQDGMTVCLLLTFQL